MSSRTSTNPWHSVRDGTGRQQRQGSLLVMHGCSKLDVINMVAIAGKRLFHSYFGVMFCFALFCFFKAIANVHLRLFFFSFGSDPSATKRKSTAKF